MGDFIKGLVLCEQFFFEIAKPVLDTYFPELKYSAGVIGYGSDVLGYDDEISTDHMWGPRFYLFLSDRDISIKQGIMDRFGNAFPYTYKGYSVNFSVPDPDDGGIRHPEYITEGPCSPLVFIHTFDEYLQSYLGTAVLDDLDAADWLSFSEHRLLALTAGKIFVDGLKIKERLDKVRYYPEDVRLYLIASNWSLIAEEQAFVRRCHDVGDNTGSMLVCCRIAERLMRLAFLYCKTYAPYSKWFGTAFSHLPIDQKIGETIRNAITAANIEDRESNIIKAQKMFADIHNKSGITECVDVKIQSYFCRNIKVIFADKIADAVMKKLSGTPLECYPRIGTLSAVGNFTSIFDDPERRDAIKGLYTQRTRKSV
jgi:hypothetical protein